MCNRYRLTRAQLRELAFLGIDPNELAERHNIAPADLPDILIQEAIRWKVIPAKWGFVPPFNFDQRPTNARAATLATNGLWRTAIQKHRCLIPADGFFEFREEADGKTKTPFLFQLRGGRAFLMAGLYSPARDETPLSFALVTCEPNSGVAQYHDRMPVILTLDTARRWTSLEPLAPEEINAICQPYPVEEMEWFEVDRRMNNSRNKEPGLDRPTQNPVPEPKSPKKKKDEAPAAVQGELF